MERVLVNIPSNPVFERVVRASADEVGQAIGFTPERIEDLKLAVSEAVNNAIEHGNRRQSAKLVEVVFSLDQEVLEVCIRDEGEGVERLRHGGRFLRPANPRGDPATRTPAASARYPALAGWRQTLRRSPSLRARRR